MTGSMCWRAAWCANCRAGTDQRPRPTRASDGRVKKPSVISADSPSLISSVDTPAQVMASGPAGSAVGTANRWLWSARWIAYPALRSHLAVDDSR